MDRRRSLRIRKSRRLVDAQDMFPFHKLPAELRNEIYRLVVPPADIKDGWYQWQPTPAICKLDRCTRAEVLPIFTGRRKFRFHDLPYDIRKRIYTLSNPDWGTSVNIQPTAIPQIVQLSRLTRRETFDTVFANKQWVWNCYSGLVTPSGYGITYAEIEIQRRAHASFGVRIPHLVGATWRPCEDTRAYLSIPDHILPLINSITVVGAAIPRASLFAFDVSLRPPARSRSAKLAKDVFSVSASTTIPRSTRGGAPRIQPLGSGNLGSDDGANSMLEDLREELKEYRPARSRTRDASQSSSPGFEQRDLYLIWRAVHNSTDGAYFGRQREGNLVRLSGLFDEVIQDYKEELAMTKVTKQRRQELLRRYYQRLETEYLDPAG